MDNHSKIELILENGFKPASPATIKLKPSQVLYVVFSRRGDKKYCSHISQNAVDYYQNGGYKFVKFRVVEREIIMDWQDND
jgi:hypothetical protein